MKIWTLVENTTLREDLSAEHGLSLYIQAQGMTILFDMGQTGAFARNARALGLNLKDVDAAVISHGHYDHGGGLRTFLEENAAAPVYLSQYAFEAHYNSQGRFIGLDPALKEHPRVRLLAQPVHLAPGITLVPEPPLPGPEPESPMTVESGGLRCPEDFRHELYLSIAQDSRVLFSGCSHRGVDRIAAYFRPHVLIGGFHLPQGTPMEQIRSAGQVLENLPTRYYTGHCTGPDAFRQMKALLGSRLEPISTGAMVRI